MSENHQTLKPICLLDLEDESESNELMFPNYQDDVQAKISTTSGTNTRTTRGTTTATAPIKGIELLDLDETDFFDDDEPDNDYFSPDPTLLAWEATLRTWKDPADIGRGWHPCGLFKLPARPGSADSEDKEFVIGSDDKVYWMYEGMFRLLDADELDRFNRWRDGDEHAFDDDRDDGKGNGDEEDEWQDVEERLPKMYVRAPFFKRGGKMTNKWYWWGLEMESIEEVDEQEEEEEKLVVWRD